MQKLQTELLVKITITSGPHKGRTELWGKGSYVVGRLANVNLPLSYDLVVSPEHCSVEISNSGCRIRDLGSRAGLALNGKQIQNSQIANGDKLGIGMSELLFEFMSKNALTETIDFSPTMGQNFEKAQKANRSRDNAGLLEIPDYSIVRKVGQGGMGIVYESIHSPSNSRVAIKTIVPAPGTSDKSIRFFQREMIVHSQLDHPNIVRFLESGQHAGQIYLAMEYVDSIDVVALTQSLNPNDRLRIYCGIIGQVLSALDYAHQKKLVHRDVKPQNILVSRDGDRWVAKLADFGLSKNFEQAGLSQMTADNELRGTPAFMPWEQIQNSRYAKPAVDIYATAATLFYFLTGRTPGHTDPSGRSQTVLSALIRQLLGAKQGETIDAEAAAALRDLPKGIGDILNSALAYSPKDRFATAGAMRDALVPFALQVNSKKF